MTSRSSARWTLDGEGLERLLALFDADREAAAQRYEDVRRRLVKLFEWRGCADPHEFADRTFDRVARKLLDGVTISSADPYAYIHGVALNVVRESWRDAARAPSPIEHAPDRQSHPEIDRVEEERAVERRHACLEKCLGTLVPVQRELLLEYHAGDRHIERRQQLAARLGIPLNALRIRVHRVRGMVEQCVARCCEDDAGREMNRAGAH
jgi:DNA-directed RNA polymerase specialized sigma24 family protein